MKHSVMRARLKALRPFPIDAAANSESFGGTVLFLHSRRKRWIAEGQCGCMRSVLILAMLAPLTASTLGADPFVGTWQFKLDRSQVPSTYRFLAVGEGKFQTDNGVGLGPVLPIDGSSHESSLGGMVSLKRIDDHTYLYTLKRKSMYKRTITLDGDKMKWAEDQELDTGQHDIFQSEWVRVGHGEGLAGEWRRVSLKAPLAEKATYTIRAFPNGLATKSSLTNFEDKTYFDGKEHADTDPDGLNEVFDSAERLDVHSYREIEKRNGKVLFTSTCKLSADENTITCTTMDNHGKKIVAVSERVSR